MCWLNSCHSSGLQPQLALPPFVRSTYTVKYSCHIFTQTPYEFRQQVLACWSARAPDLEQLTISRPKAPCDRAADQNKTCPISEPTVSVGRSRWLRRSLRRLLSAAGDAAARPLRTEAWRRKNWKDPIRICVQSGVAMSICACPYSLICKGANRQAAPGRTARVGLAAIDRSFSTHSPAQARHVRAHDSTCTLPRFSRFEGRPLQQGVCTRATSAELLMLRHSIQLTAASGAWPNDR